MTRWLFYSASFTPRGGGPHFAGGDHAFECMARTFAALGHRVHLLHQAPRDAVFAAAAQGGFLPKLSYSPEAEGVTRWRAAGVEYHAALTDADISAAGLLQAGLGSLGFGGGGGGGYGSASGSGGGGGGAHSAGGGGGGGGGVLADAYPGHVLQRLIIEGEAALRGGGGGASGSGGGGEDFWVVVDADGAQRAPPAAGARAPLLAALAARWGRRVLALVQNIHFIPFGPEGTVPRTEQLLTAWSQIGGAICPSQFVAGYLAASAEADAGALDAARRVCVVPYAAWGAFGAPPFEDLGAQAAARVRAREEARARQEGVGEAAAGSSGGGGGLEEDAPVISMLKLSREKGSDLFFALARRLPAYRFVGVTSDRQLLQQAAALGPPNVTLLPPQEDVTAALAGAWAVIAPSVWQEVYGMVVPDALLRGLPVLTSNAGGLPEAGLGAAAALLVVRMALPAGAPGGDGAGGGSGDDGGCGGGRVLDQFPCPSWRGREFPEQPASVVDAWAAALASLLEGPGAAARYEAAARAARKAGAALVADRNGPLRRFKAFLDSIEAAGE